MEGHRAGVWQRPYSGKRSGNSQHFRIRRSFPAGYALTRAGDRKGRPYGGDLRFTCRGDPCGRPAENGLYTKTVCQIRTKLRIRRSILFLPQRGRMSAQLTGEGENRGSPAIVSASPSSPSDVPPSNARATGSFPRWGKLSGPPRASAPAAKRRRLPCRGDPCGRPAELGKPRYSLGGPVPCPVRIRPSFFVYAATPVIRLAWDRG